MIFTVNIRYGDLTAVIRKRGANCISFKNSKYNVNVLRESGAYDKLDNPYLYGMPILFPVNRISGGSFVFEDRTYTFPINEPQTGCHLHGEIHNKIFDVENVSEDSVTMSLTVLPTAGFMHKYRISITYSLCEKGLIHKTEVVNLSDMNMPCLLGFHTTFNLPFVEDSEGVIRVLADVGDEIERDKNYLPTGRILHTDEIGEKIGNGTFDPRSVPISRHYPAKASGRIELYDTAKNIRIIYNNDSSFKYRLFYNGNADKYICLEPQNCMVNSPNSPFGREASGFEFLPPNSSKTFKSEILIKKEEIKVKE